jgi:arylsulfatase A-like enzyme
MTHFFKYVVVCIVLLASTQSLLGNNPQQTQKVPEKMNIIFILADDLGWNDVTIYGNKKLHETPNIERLAARGMTFTNAYAASPLCSPTRASILTGQTPARTGITNPGCHVKEVHTSALLEEKASPGSKIINCVSATRLRTDQPTLGKLLKAEGYTTAHFGKWHLGLEPYSPLEHGFDTDIPHWGGPGPAGSFVAPWKFPNFKENYPKEHIEDRMADEAVKWLHSIDSNKPFFMNYWQFSVHAPFNAKESLIEYYRTKVNLNELQNSSTYAAMVHSLDQAVGTLLEEVDRMGIADNTAIIFFSDNGGNQHSGVVDKLPSGEEYITTLTNNYPLRGGKACMYDGGIRVPCIVVWPGVTEPGSVSDKTIQSTDFYPTILNMIGANLPTKHTVDGVDISPVLKGGDIDREAIFTYFPHGPKIQNWLPPSVAVHSGNWKLIRLFHQGDKGEHEYLLYNIRWDIGEQNDLSKKFPEKVKQLDAMIERYLEESNAVVPLPNPNFDPAKYKQLQYGFQIGGYKATPQINID